MKNFNKNKKYCSVTNQMAGINKVKRLVDDVTWQRHRSNNTRYLFMFQIQIQIWIQHKV